MGALDTEAGASAASRDSELESRLTWIWGSPRSGSTWLLKLLTDPLEADPEVPLGFRLPEGGLDGSVDSVPVDESFISNHLAPSLAEPRRVNGRWVPGTLNNLMRPKPAYVFSDEYTDVWRPAARQFALARFAGVLDRVRAERVALADDYRVVIKETNGSHAADVVMETLPASKLLLLIRDGRDVVDSILAAYKPKAFMANKFKHSFKTSRERSEGARWAAEKWACNTDMTLKAMEGHPAELTRVVRYEDLLADGVRELGALYEWMGLPREPGRVERIVADRSFSALPADDRGPLTRNRAASPGLWRENLSRKEQRTVHEVCGPLLERFGYEV